MDKKAMVQIAGSKEWRPLKEVIAEMRVAAKYAGREKRDAEQKRQAENKRRAEEERQAEEELRAEAARRARELIERSSRSPEEAQIGAPAGVQALADEPIGVQDEPASAVAPGPSVDAVRPPIEPTTTEPNPFRGAFIDEEAAVAVATDEPTAILAPESTAEPPVMLTKPSDEDVSRLVDSVDSARVDESRIGVPPDIQTLADEPSGPRPTEPVAEAPVILPTPDLAPVISVKPSADAPASPPPATRRPGDVRVDASPGRVRVVVRDPVTRPAVQPPPSRPPMESSPPPMPPKRPAREASTQVLADDVAPPPPPRSSPTRSPVDRLPVIPMKPLDDAASPGTTAWDGAQEDRSGGLSATLLAATAALGALLSRFLQPISRLERGRPLVDEDGPPLIGPSLERLRRTSSEWAGDLRERAPSRLASALQAATSTVSAWVGGVPERLGSLARSRGGRRSSPSPPDPTLDSPLRSEPEPAVMPVEPGLPEHPVYQPPTPPPAPFSPPTPAPSARKPLTRRPAATPPLEPGPSTDVPQSFRPAPRVPQKPPPSFTEMEVVPFSEGYERRETLDDYEDVYEEGGRGIGDVWGAAWAGMKVLVVIAVVAGGVGFAAVNWRTWFPRAAKLGEATFTEVDRLAHSTEHAEQEQRAVEDLTGQLPHLAPETIRLILSRSATGVLEAREVFEIAGDATDRGFGSLTADEATELDALGTDLHEGLGPLERERLVDYGRTRARRLIFPEEHAHALALVARGAQVMPSEKRQRLQELLAKAIAAGLGPPPEGQ